ncbi:MAG: hypothetical protein QM479_07500, partial [Pseudomonadota bacterium]
MNNSMEFLMWVKGPAFDFALFIFICGITIRILEIVILGRKQDLAAARSSQEMGGLRNIFSRSMPEAGILKRAPFTVIMGYIWHIAWFISFLLFIPHIELFTALTGLAWPGLANQIVDFAAVVAIISLIAVLIHRITHPVLSFLSGFEDYLVWLVTFLPLFTGYLAFHHIIEPYTLFLALHILSAELLMVVFPFTKLMHAITVVMARWYSGVSNGRKLA